MGWWGSRGGGGTGAAPTAAAADAPHAAAANDASPIQLPPLPDRRPLTVGQRRRARAARLRPGIDRVEDTTEELLMGLDPRGGGGGQAEVVRAQGYGRPAWQLAGPPSLDPDDSPAAAVEFVKLGLPLPPRAHARLVEAADRARREIDEARASGFPPRERERAEAGRDLRRRRARARAAGAGAGGSRPAPARPDGAQDPGWSALDGLDGARRRRADAAAGPDTESDEGALADPAKLAARYRARVAERTRLVRGRGEADVAWLKHKAYTRGLAAIRAVRLAEEEEARREVEGVAALPVPPAGGGGGGGGADADAVSERRRRYLASKGAPLDVVPAELIDLPPLAAAAAAARGARLTGALEAEARRLGLLAGSGSGEEEEGGGEEEEAAAALAPPPATVRPCCAAKRAAAEAAEAAALAAAAAVPAGVWADDPAVRDGVVAELRARGVLRPPPPAEPAPAAAATAPPVLLLLGMPSEEAAPTEADPSMAMYTREHRALLRARAAELQRARARSLAFGAGVAGAALARLALAWLRRRRRRGAERGKGRGGGSRRGQQQAPSTAGSESLP